MTGETEKDVSGWTTDTLRTAMLSEFHAIRASIADLRTLLDERYETQSTATAAAFAAQQVAMRTALEAAEKAVAVAMTSAEKAVAKAETAADKRFEATNEFRGQLNDMVTTLLPRAEADVRFAALAEKLDRLSSHQDKTMGRDQGAAEQVITRRLDTGQLVTIALLLVAVAGVVVAVVR